MSTQPHDPGGKVRLNLELDVVGSALFSDCGRYRHLLLRRWVPLARQSEREPFALWIGMNPSTADAKVDDPTVRREITFTRRLRLGCYIKTNVMSYRATKPQDLLAPGVEPCSPENLGFIRDAADEAEVIIAAWGSLHKKLQHYALSVESALRADGRDILCLGTTKHGNWPRHPLYVKGDTPLIPYRREA
jgi:hypothetical protein